MFSEFSRIILVISRKLLAVSPIIPLLDSPYPPILPMRSQSFRIRVSESMISLPILVVLASVIWMIPDIQSVALWGGLAAVGMMTYVMIAWNTQYQLIRVRSRMISISFLYVFLAFPQLHVLGFHLFPAACLLGAYFLLFRTYGVYAPQGYFFSRILPRWIRKCCVSSAFIAGAVSLLLLRTSSSCAHQ